MTISEFLEESKMNKIDYPDAILRLRAKLNVSQSQLAEMLGTSLSSIGRWETGKFEPTVLAKIKLQELFAQYKIDTKEKE